VLESDSAAAGDESSLADQVGSRIDGPAVRLTEGQRLHA
jgi:hypothetical protein